MEIDSQETVPSKSNFEQDRITDDVKNKIFKSTFDLQAKLEFLGLEKEKAEQRSEEETAEYGSRLREIGFFRKEDIIHTNKNLVRSKTIPLLKPGVFVWMERYTIHEETALSVASLAMQTMIHIKSKISTEPFHTTKPKRNGNYKKSFQELFTGTRYENVLEMMLGVLSIFNQCVNEKTKENKMIKETKNTAEVCITVSANTENNEKKHSQAVPMTVIHLLKDKVQSIVCYGILKGDTEEQPKKSEKDDIADDLHKDSQVSQETKETNIEKHNVDGEQQNDIKIEDETAGETHVPRNRDESICNQKLPSKDPEVDTLLLATVRSIPETHVCECFGVDYKSFISDMDRVQMSDETRVSILQQILAKYEKWK
jgi:hypothetical protein